MSRIEKLREQMRENEIDAYMISSADNRRYISGFSGSFGTAVITHSEALLITDGRYTLQASEQCKGFDVRAFAPPTNGTEFLYEQILSLGVKEIGFDSTAMTVAQLESFKEKMPELEFKSAPDLAAPLRLVKDADEIALIKQAVGIVDAGFKHIQLFLQEGAVEYDLGLELEFFIRRHSAELGFAPIVVSGFRSAYPHGRPSEKQFANGDFVTLDFGARYEGYHSDITRTVVIGKANDEHRRIYNAVLEAQLAAMEAMKPGIEAKAVDQIARDALAKYDLAQYFTHGLGHSLGIACHDGGSLSQVSTNVLEAGQVWTVEPGVYIEGYGGVRIEDDVVVTDKGVEILTQSPKHLMEMMQ